MRTKRTFKNSHFLALIAFVMIAFSSLTACTGAPQGIRLGQTTEVFEASIAFNSKLDLLWVVDNSASMDVSQKKLRQGLVSFATKYMKPTWDIHVAVISTDAFIANSAFNNYRNNTVSGSVNYLSNYILGRNSTWVNPSYNPTLVNISTGRFTSGFRMIDLFPDWSSNYAKLMPGTHDGPIRALCFEALPYFILGIAQCQIRDDQTNPAYSDTSHCLNPLGAETSETQCVNTVENSTVKSGKAVIKTMPPIGVPADAAWTQQLINDFTINITTGTIGAGSERGFASVIQLLSDNEPSAYKFFRPDATRGIIFVSDEDDQSMLYVGGQENPYQNYACDQAGLLALNASNPGKITGPGGYCCSSGCSYGSLGTTCPSKTVGGLTYTPSICPATTLMTVNNIKNQLDGFFRTLDGADSSANPNYFIGTITPLTDTSIQTIQNDRSVEDAAVGSVVAWAADRADRYIALGNNVGNGSVSLDLASADYTPLLDAIGQAIVQNKSTFTLSRVPDPGEFIVLTLNHADHTSEQIPASKWSLSGQNVIITDLDYIITTFRSGDTIGVSYYPITI